VNSVRSLLVVLALVLAGCGHPLASVKQTTARYVPSVGSPGEIRQAQQHILAAEKLQKSDSLGAIGEYLRATEAALAQLRRQPADLDA